MFQMNLFLLALVSAIAAATAKNVVCYYGSWAVYRPGNGKFDVEQIDPFLCTHIIFGFAGLRESDNNIYALDPYNELYENWGRGAYERFTGLKNKNPSLTALLAIGGWNEGSTKYSKMASTYTTRRQFIDSVIPFLKTYRFDGLDVDWEYPTQRGGRPEDQTNFILLLKELREALDKEGLLLTIAVSAGEQSLEQAYNVPEVSRYVHLVNLMAYDFHGAWEQFTGHNAPLLQHPRDAGNETNFNVDFAVRRWLEKGLDPAKLNLGMGLYGRGWTLDNPAENGMFAPAANPLPAGPYTREAGVLGYNEICEKFKAEPNTWTIVRDSYAQAPYAYQGRYWIGYDDVESLTKKLELIQHYNLAGGMVWSIETDDFRGICSSKVYPLITHIKEYLNGKAAPVVQVSSTTTPATIAQAQTTTAPQVTTTTTKAPIISSPNERCPAEGYYQKDCSNYYYCQWDPNTSTWYITEFSCVAGTSYDPITGNCNWSSEVEGCH